MDHRRIARLEVHAHHRLVLGHRRWDHEVAIDVVAGRRDIEGLSHGQHQVRSAHAPILVRQDDLGRPLRYGSFGRVVIRPGGEQRDLALGQIALVAKPAMVGIGPPRRHEPLRGDVSQHIGPAIALLIGLQRKGSNTIGLVTLDAVGCEDRCNVAMIGGCDSLVVLPGAEEAADGIGAQRLDSFAVALRLG